jgi:cell division protein FtsN
MANNGGNRSSAAGNNSSLILGILIGMVLGLAIAGGIAWHISSRPNNFSGKYQHEPATNTPSAVVTPSQKNADTATATAASGVSDGKPRFEFYKILTDKENGTPSSSGHTPNQQKENAKSTVVKPYFLQAGSFSNEKEAEGLKAKLAMLGMEASVQTADIPGKGTHYRVRLGPYHNADDLKKANNTLKQNGINDAAQVRAQ